MGVDSRPGDLLTGIYEDAKDIVIVAPYIKADALSRVIGKVGNDVSLTCVTRWQVEDVVAGASDVDCYSTIKQVGGEFRLHPSLHAKYFRADEHILIGSANVTNSALGWATEPNVEILCSPGADFDAATFETMLVEDSREIGDREFARWQSIESTISQDDRKEFSEHKWPHLNTWRPTTRDPSNLLLAYWGFQDEIASSDELRSAKRDLDILHMPQGMTGEDIENQVSLAFLTSTFVQAVLQLRDEEITSVSKVLADRFDLSVTDARRGVETVHNWYAFFLSD